MIKINSNEVIEPNIKTKGALLLINLKNNGKKIYEDLYN